MFNSKQKQLFSVKEKQKTSASPKSAFVKAGLKKGAETLSGNGALKYKTTGNPFVDQFGKLGSYKKPRTFQEIEVDCEALWAEDPLKAAKMAYYIRMITRTVDYELGATSTPQKGAELRHEGIMRFIWLLNKIQAGKAFSTYPYKEFLALIPAVGSWKDIITMLQYDLIYHGWKDRILPWDLFGLLILSALKDKRTSELMKKYLPQIRASSQCTTVEAQADTIIGKWICSLLFEPKNEDDYSGYRKYRKLKASGTAHEWQKLISQKKMDLIDFSKIHGRALSLLVKSKFLKNQGLSEKYTAWVTKPETKVKYTGFVHELFSELGANGGYSNKYATLSMVPIHMQETINKQFATLVEKGRTDNITSLIVVRDTSGSMSSTATGTNMTCYAIAKALALYFSEFLEGKFSDSWIEFNSDAKMHAWKGNTPVEKWFGDTTSFVGDTDFQSVIKLFCKIKAQGVPESEFPSGILCISDGEFNPTSALNETNVQRALKTLEAAGFSQEYIDNFVITLWNLQSRAYGPGTGEKFETYGNVPNVYYFSGYSAATVSFLSSRIRTASELVDAALDQEILNLIKLTV